METRASALAVSAVNRSVATGLSMQPAATEHLIGGYPLHFGYAGDGGAAIDAYFDSPSAIAVGPDGGVYVADTGNNLSRVLAAPRSARPACDSALADMGGREVRVARTPRLFTRRC